MFQYLFTCTRINSNDSVSDFLSNDWTIHTSTPITARCRVLPNNDMFGDISCIAKVTCSEEDDIVTVTKPLVPYQADETQPGGHKPDWKPGHRNISLRRKVLKLQFQRELIQLRLAPQDDRQTGTRDKPDSSPVKRTKLLTFLKTPPSSVPPMTVQLLKTATAKAPPSARENNLIFRKLKHSRRERRMKPANHSRVTNGQKSTLC